MLLDRIESPVPDWTLTPAATLNAMVLPWPPPCRRSCCSEASLLMMMPLISLPRGSVPETVGADVVALDEVARRRGAVDA